MDNRGGYQIVDTNTQMIVAGEKFDLSLEDVERLAAEEDTDNQEPGLEERSKKIEMWLRQDDDGCYWLDYMDQPDMRSRGPFDFDEVKDWIAAVENGCTMEQVEEYVTDQRWRCLHSDSKAG